MQIQAVSKAIGGAIAAAIIAVAARHGVVINQDVNDALNAVAAAAAGFVIVYVMPKNKQ